MRITEAFAAIAIFGLLLLIAAGYAGIWMDGQWIGKLAITGILTFVVGFVGAGIAGDIDA